jgi:hypothetical protein
VDFIHAHQRQCGLAPRGRPALQVTQIDRPHGTWPASRIAALPAVPRHSRTPRPLPPQSVC